MAPLHWLGCESYARIRFAALVRFTNHSEREIARSCGPRCHEHVTRWRSRSVLLPSQLPYHAMGVPVHLWLFAGSDHDRGRTRAPIDQNATSGGWLGV